MCGCLHPVTHLGELVEFRAPGFSTNQSKLFQIFGKWKCECHIVSNKTNILSLLGTHFVFMMLDIFLDDIWIVDLCRAFNEQWQRCNGLFPTTFTKGSLPSYWTKIFNMIKWTFFLLHSLLNFVLVPQERNGSGTRICIRIKRKRKTNWQWNLCKKWPSVNNLADKSLQRD